MRYGDLHLHTTCSDGSLTPEQTVQAAVKAGLDLIAITDHDTVAACKTAITEGHKVGLRVVAGIEVSSSIGEKSVHILGYGVDMDSEAIETIAVTGRAKRLARLERVCGKLAELNIDIEFDELMTFIGQKTPGRALLAQFLVFKGFFGNVNEVFARVLGDRKAAYEPVENFTPAEVIDLLHSAGGVASLAHPGVTKIDEHIGELASAGLDGIEVFSPQHNIHSVSKYRLMAQKYSLIETGGSDSHGVELAGGREVGSVRVPVLALERLMEKKKSGSDVAA